MKFEPKDFEIIEPIIKKSLDEYFREKEKNDFEKKLYSISEIQKILGMSYNWVAGKIKDGTLKTTSDGKFVTGKEINSYLGQ